MYIFSTRNIQFLEGIFRNIMNDVPGIEGTVFPAQCFGSIGKGKNTLGI